MKTRIRIIGLAVAVTVIFSSCMSIDIESQIPDKVVSMTPIPEEIEHSVVGSFNEELRVYFTVNGLIPASQLEIDDVIETAIAKYHGDGVVNLSINDQYSGIDILLQVGLTAGGYLLGYLFAPSVQYAGTFGSVGASVMQFFVQSRTVTVSGDVFRLE